MCLALPSPFLPACPQIPVVLAALVAATRAHLYGYGYGIPYGGYLRGITYGPHIHPIPYGYGLGHHYHLIRKRSADPTPRPQQGDVTVFGTGLKRDKSAQQGSGGVYTLLGQGGYNNPGYGYTIVGNNGFTPGNTGIYGLGNNGVYGQGGNTGLFGTNTGIYPTTGYGYGNYFPTTGYGYGNYPVYTVGGYPSTGGNTVYYIPTGYGNTG